MTRATKNAKRKAVAPRPVPRQAARVAEEKHIGYETTDWENVKDFEAAFRETLRHYGYFYDIKDAHKWAVEYLKSIKSKKLKSLRAAEPWRVSMTVGSMAKMMVNGAKFDEDRMTWFNVKLNEAIDAGNAKIEAEKDDDSPKAAVPKSPAELVKEKTSDFIGRIEEVIDTWETQEDYSVYDELLENDAAYVTAKSVADYYAPIRDEIALLVLRKDPELLEAYEYMPVCNRVKYLKFLETLVLDAEKYMAMKKAKRKTRVKKTPSVGAQVSKVQYLKDSKEFKIASVAPTQIVGATEVWLFNVKYRYLSRLVTNNKKGFNVKGTTIQDVDLESSDKRKLRNPKQFFGEVATHTKAKLNEAYKALTTRPDTTTGRINSDTIIFKVY